MTLYLEGPLTERPPHGRVSRAYVARCCLCGNGELVTEVQEPRFSKAAAETWLRQHDWIKRGRDWQHRRCAGAKAKP